MKRKEWLIVSAICLLAYLGLAATSWAVYIDDNKTLQFIAKAQARASIRLNDAQGFTFPDVRTGDLVQQRNLILLEVDHDLNVLKHSLDILYPLKALKIDARYRLVGRFMYEGVYDYGPQMFQDVKERDKENITKFSQQYDLWEFYFDFSRGPWFLRIGKQNLAWGETDIFRLLDYINPLDNTFGGSFEDLDDRRIPLWMIRGNYDLGRLGPIASLMVEGFWVPGSWDARVAPIAPLGTPYSAPLPVDLVSFARAYTPDKTLSNSRWGVKLQGLVGTSLNLSVAHYKTFLDAPAFRFVVTEDVPLLLDLDVLEFEISYPSVQITGGSLSYWEPNTDAIIRAEVALFWDEPVVIPQENFATLYGPVIPVPPGLIDLVSEIVGVDLGSLGVTGIPVNPQSGTIAKKNIFRYMIGIDKQVWCRPLNSKSTFTLSFQYFGQWIPDYDDRLVQPAPMYPSLTDYPKVYELEQMFTGLVTTTYLNGSLFPQFALGYDVRGAFLVLAAVNYIWDPFRFGAQYAGIEGNFTNFGIFRDRDQVSFFITYLLN